MDALTPLDRLLIESECRRLSLSFAHCNDGRRFEELARLFTDDGSFTRPLSGGRPLRGRDEILADLAAKPASRLSRHLCMNVLVEISGPTEASGVTSFAVLVQPDADTYALPIDFTGDTFIGEYRDRYRHTLKGWRIAERVGSIALRVAGRTRPLL